MGKYFLIGFLVLLIIFGVKLGFNVDGITQNAVIVATLVMITERLGTNGAIIYVKYRPNRYYWKFGAKSDVFS